MKDTATGDQSGGLNRRDGASTPAHHRGHNTNKSSSQKAAESTDQKNPSDAFKQTPRKVINEKTSGSQDW